MCDVCEIPNEREVVVYRECLHCGQIEEQVVTHDPAYDECPACTHGICDFCAAASPSLP